MILNIWVFWKMYFKIDFKKHVGVDYIGSIIKMQAREMEEMEMEACIKDKFVSKNIVCMFQNVLC